MAWRWKFWTKTPRAATDAGKAADMLRARIEGQQGLVDRLVEERRRAFSDAWEDALRGDRP